MQCPLQPPANRAYNTPPVFPVWDERHTTHDYGLVHLAMTITKRPIFHAIVHLLLPSEAVLVLQCRKVFFLQVEQAAEQKVHRHLQALEHARAAFLLPSPHLAYYSRYLHQLPKALKGSPAIGFRFAAIKSFDEETNYSILEQIYSAARRGHLDELLRLCQEWAGHVDIEAYIDKDSNNALHVAVINGQEACVRVLIAAGFRVSRVNDYNWTALHFAADVGLDATCRVLIDEGASPFAVNRKCHTPWELAKAKNRVECVAVLESARAAKNPSLAAAYTFVDEHIATTRGFRFAVTKAADEQAPPGLDEQIYNAAQNYGKLDELLGLCQEWAGHPVIDAYKNVSNMFLKCSQMPTRRQSRTDLKKLITCFYMTVLTSPNYAISYSFEQHDRNALFIATVRGNEACVRVLIAAKANAAFENNDGYTALHWAACNDRASILHVLIQEGTSHMITNCIGKKPINYAIEKGACGECLDILLKAAQEEKEDAAVEA